MNNQTLPATEKDVLRRLAEELAAAAASPGHKERSGLWTQLNDLRSVRPMVWITEIPWHEMNVDNELTLHCEDVRVGTHRHGNHQRIHSIGTN